MSKKHKISGKRSGPPPLRGPNPNVPPIKMRYGGGADMGDPGRAQDRANKGYGSTAGPDRSKVTSAQESNNQNAISSAQKYNQQKANIDKGINFGKAALTLAGSKLLNVPLGAINLLNNIAKPQIADMKLGKNLNDYDPMFHTARYNPPAMAPIGGEGQKGLCPDGSMPPCEVVQASDGKAIRVRGTKAAIRGTGFKGVF